ncbi:MAG: hypothetical protein A07HR60_01466 [uncultured archaeon A07HR60]|jgi:hypothetical protein|nr:MAG: hypothetical protein A07HR60_01466 [uncultured archaeon A07HR60]
MEAKDEFRDRREEEVAILDALCDRMVDGMTVFELRAAVDSDIDTIETALSQLKSDGLIRVEAEDSTVRVFPHDKVVPDPDGGTGTEQGLFDRVRQKFNL